MTVNPRYAEHARKVADAILYEGYLLYPYRASAQKNRARFQFGVLMPPAYAAVDPTEPSGCQAECLLEGPADATVRVLVRFLQLRHRRTESPSPDDGARAEEAADVGSWDEAAEQEQAVVAPLGELLSGPLDADFSIAGGQQAEELVSGENVQAGRVLRSWDALEAAITVRAERTGGPYGAIRLHVGVQNRTTPEASPRNREEALRHALIAAHVLIIVPGAAFLSMTDPPEWASADVARCVSVGLWPVLAGPSECREIVLASPIILPDHPEVAAESAGDMFDATEIDEILTLRTLALTEAENREVRATDPRAAALLDRLGSMPPEMLERMHGAIRYLRSVPAGSTGVPAASQGGGGEFGGAAGAFDPAAAAFLTDVPWWDPGSDASVSPATDSIVIGGVPVSRGSVVTMRPGSRRADAQDFFLAGRQATVQAVLFDVDGQVHVAVSPVADPAAELQAGHGRFLYFAPDEIEPIEEGGNR